MAKKVKTNSSDSEPEKSDRESWNVFINPMMGENIEKNIFGGAGFIPKDSFMGDECFVPVETEYRSYNEIGQSIKFISAGPRSHIFYDTTKVKAVILTCGGLCPGLNVVIREIVMTLHFSY